MWLNQWGNREYLLILVGVAIATHLIWFTPGTTLFHNDWLHRPTATMNQAWDMERVWKDFSNFGTPNIQIGFFLVTILWPLIGHLGGGFDAGVKLTMMIPIAILGFVGPYFAMQKLIRDRFVAFIVALFYGSTTYFLLLQTVQLPIAFVYALAPLTFFLFAMAMDSMKMKDWLLFALVYSVGLCYEVRITYIVTFVLALYTFFSLNKSSLTKLPKPLLITGLSILTLNGFWLVPTLLGGVGSNITQLTSRSLFGGWLFDLPHALALSASNWTGGATTGGFIMEPIKLYLWIVPIIALVPLAIGAKLRPHGRKQILFFSILTVIGIFLTKQVLDPLPQAYPWLYAHFPGFSLFREASKFYLLTAWGYMGLLGVGLIVLKRLRRKIFYVASISLILVACINLLPLVTGDIGGLFVSRQIPHDYTILNNRLASQTNMTRTLWTPTYSQWAYFDITHPEVSAVTIMQQDWKSLITDTSDSLHQRFLTFFNEPFARNLMDAGSIRLVVVPLRDTVNDDDFFDLYGNNRQFYIDMFNKVPWLKRVNIGTKEIAVYENQSSKPYIAAATSLLSLPSLDNLQQFYQLNADTLKTDFSFALNDKRQVRHGTDMKDIFDSIGMSNVHKGQLSTTTYTNGHPVLYANTNKSSISYKVVGGTIELFATWHKGILVNGQLLGSKQNDTHEIGSTAIAPGRQYFIVMGSQVLSVDTANKKQGDLGTASGPVRLTSNDKSNLIPNPSLETGLWQKQVADCDNYDNDAVIGMQISNSQRSQGQKSLELDADTHDACTGPNSVSVTPGQEYLLSFDYKDYKVESHDEVGYQILFNDPQHTAIKQYPSVENGSWHTVRQLVTIPKGATTLKLRLLAIPRTQSSDPMVVFYDNLFMAKLVTNIKPQLNLTPHYAAMSLQSSKNTFRFAAPALTGKNLIPNPSLENGLWQKKVADCDNYDDNPALKMSTTNRASDGEKSLQLAAERHIACTGPNAIPVQENASYLLSFDHESPNTKTASYSINFDDPNDASISGDTPTGTSWQNFTRVIKVPPGAHNAQILFYANAGDSDTTYIVNRYDNLKFVQIPDVQDQYYLVNVPTKKTVMPKSVNYTLVNPTKKSVRIRGANGPFYLTMSEAYHPRWRLELDNSHAEGWLASWMPWIRPNSVPTSDHIKWDDFMNGWYVDPAQLCKNNVTGCTREADGSYDLDMEIEFSSQRWFYVGSVISLISLAVCIGYLFYAYRRDKKSKVYHSR